MQVPRLQVTPRLLVSPGVVAVNWYVWLIKKGGAPAGGATLTVTPDVTVNGVEPDTVLSATDVAVIVIDEGDGTIIGAVYVAVALPGVKLAEAMVP